VEALFAHTYLILFGKLAVGGLFALAVPPFVDMERGFYKSSAAVYLLLAWAMAGGDAYLAIRFAARGIVSGTALGLWIAFALVFTAYFTTLFVELPFLRARLFPLGAFLGAASLTATAHGYVPPTAAVFMTIPFAVVLLSGACVVGAASTGMLLGHWYLIDTGLDLTPLRRMLAYCRFAVRFEIVAVLLAALVLYAWPGSSWHDAYEAAFRTRFVWLVVARVSCWTLSLLLLQLIARTLAIPQTMAATGLFYIQALVVAVGQIVGHWLLFRTGLPL